MRCAHRRLEPREQYGVVERRADLADAAADVLRGTSVENDARRLVAGIARARADRIVERECARAADEGAIELSCRDGDVLPACAGIVVRRIFAEDAVDAREVGVRDGRLRFLDGDFGVHGQRK